VPAIDLLRIFSPSQWEDFALEWAHSLKSRYQRVERCGGAGDLGRDVVALASANEWHNYQCKHYKDPLQPNHIVLELGKLCYYVHEKAFSAPSQYYFVAPQGAGNSLSLLFRKPEDALRREFNIPWAARAVSYEATPAEPGWFGREGLRITMVFQLSAADFNELARAAATSGTWQPLPIPDRVLHHLAGSRTSREARARAAQESGRALPPEGTIGNPTEQQILDRFKQSMPSPPPRGLYQIRTAGSDIMHAPKTVGQTLNVEVNDFMLAMLDPEHHKVVIRVRTNY